MKILVIGSSGQLGTDCLNVLGNKHEVIGIDYPAIDLADRTTIARALDAISPETIINCAAFTAVDACESQREKAWAINCDGPRRLAELAGDSRIVHVSTDYVFDGARGVPLPYREDAPANPLSEYGKSKLAGEQAVISRAPKALILRTAWLYSAHGPNFLKTMLRLALSDPLREYTIVDDQFGSLTWSCRLAEQIGLLLETDICGIVHATSDGYSSWYEAACFFLEQMAVPHAFAPCTTADYPTAARRPMNSILQNKVLDDLGLSVFKTWQDDVCTFAAKFREKLIAEALESLERAS